MTKTNGIWNCRIRKLIESQYITRSIQGRADELVVKELNYRNTISSKLSNLSLQLYGIMLKTGCKKRMPNSISMIILENIFQNSINQNLASVKNTGFIMPICAKFLVQDFYHATNML
jgi:hypothetical protein